MSLRPRSRLSWALVASAALALSVLPITAASAGGNTKTSSFAAVISPTTATVGQQQAFTLTVSNASTSSNSIGSVQVVVPSASVAGVTVNSPTGWVSTFPSCSPDSPTGCGTQGSTLVQVNTPSNSGANKVGAGLSLTFTITAVAPTTPGKFTWYLAAKNSAAWSSGPVYAESKPDPQVTISPGPPASLTVTGPAGPVRAGDPFPVTATVTDAYGNPVDPVAVTAQVDGSTGSPLSGLTQAGAVTLMLTAPTLPGTGYLLTVAVSGTALSKTMPFTVVPGPPTHLSIDPVGGLTPGALLSSGSLFDVQVTTRDRFENPSPFAGTLALTASGGTPAATLGSLQAPQVTMDGTSTVATFTGVTYSGFGYGITLTASASPAAGQPSLTAGTTTFDMNAYVATGSGTTSFSLSAPGRAVATLGNGATGTVALVVNACNTAGPACPNNDSQIQLSGNFKDANGNPLYGFGTPASPLPPASISWLCPASVCPHPDASEEPYRAPYNYWGNDEGWEEFSTYPVYVSLRRADGTYKDFAAAPACVPKTDRSTVGKIVTAQAQTTGFCVDVNAITRAGKSFAGALSMPVLFVEDPRLRP